MIFSWSLKRKETQKYSPLCSGEAKEAKSGSISEPTSNKLRVTFGIFLYQKLLYKAKIAEDFAPSS